MTTRRSPTPGIRPFRRLHADEGGQISVLGVVAAAAFACMLLLVMNTGSTTSGKIELQNSADATALSGAAWMARGLNIISLNNVTQTQILAIILVIRALDSSIDPAVKTLRAEYPLCGLLGAFSVGCKTALDLQISILNGLQNAIALLPRDLAREGGPLWVSMRALSAMSSTVETTFPVIGEAEAIRIARGNGADVGVLIPARWTDKDGLPSLPAHDGSLRPDLCDPTRNGSPSNNSRGYTPLLKYPLGWGPLSVYTADVEAPLTVVVNSFIQLYFYANREWEYRSVCGGTGSVPTATRAGSLEECRIQGGGQAEWVKVELETITYGAPQPWIRTTPLANLLQVSKSQTVGEPFPMDCAWTPGCPRMESGKYRCTHENDTPVGKDDDGNPIVKYSYDVDEYDFMSGVVTGRRQPPAEPVAGNNDPYPILLGGDARTTLEQVRKDLRYFAVVYRSRQAVVAPDYFVSPYGRHRIAYAQARVYNPTAWDTFTQDWRVTLDRTSMLDPEDGTLMGGLHALDATTQPPGVLDALLGFFGGMVAALNNH
jgi:hypothetical protein